MDSHPVHFVFIYNAVLVTIERPRPTQIQTNTLLFSSLCDAEVDLESNKMDIDFYSWLAGWPAAPNGKQ